MRSRSTAKKVKASGVRHVTTLPRAAWRIGDLKLHGALREDNERTRTVLGADTVELCNELSRKFSRDVLDLHEHRRELKESTTKAVRDGHVESLLAQSTGNWKVAPTPPNAETRRVEITGPANDAKMVINLLNSGADACMIDLEDSMAPSGENVLNGHFNIHKALRGEFVHEQMKDGALKRYQINGTQTTPMVRVRGLHLDETHATAAHVGPMPATLFDIGVHLSNNGKFLQKRGLGPYLYMPKLHSEVEAALLEDVLSFCEKELSLDNYTTKVTALIETLPAALRTDEIAHALSNRMIGQNCGRWDWLASRSYYLGGMEDYVHPDREHTGMDQSFNLAYSKQVVQTAHKRGFHAMGGMSAFIPVSGDAQATEAALKKVSADKALEIRNGHDGAWVAHPGMVPAVLDQFKASFGANPHQKGSTASMSEKITAKDIIAVAPELRATEMRTESGLRYNISVALQYMAQYLSGNGAAAINNQMEDLATFEMSRHSIRSWVDSGVDVTFDHGKTSPLTMETVEHLVAEERHQLSLKVKEVNFDQASEVLIRGLKENPEYICSISNEYLNKDYARGLTLGSRVLRPLTQLSGGKTTPGAPGVAFEADLVRSLQGSRPELKSGVDLTRHRGRFLNRLLASGSCYKFMGCASGLAAAAVIHGGEGLVGPYCGGWQLNAMGLEESRPDTLWVKPEDPGNLAGVLNNFLALQDKIQMVDTINELSRLQGLPKEQFQTGIQALQDKVNGLADFHDMAMLADLEQGYGDVKYTRYGVQKGIENGINVLHIEDQGPKKRCGHLGDKELDTFDHAIQIMTSANYTAQEIMGPEQIDERLVKFCFRTDALSALRIVYSKALEDPGHVDHQFVDWARGHCPDGRYLWLKKGTNPATGNPYGLDQSIHRAADMVGRGLADFVWMETPDADIRVAKTFLDGVNARLIDGGSGRTALGLYNFSPSFIWDKNYYPDAKVLATQVAEYATNTIAPALASGKIDDAQGKAQLQAYLVKEGDRVRGDHLFTAPNLDRIYSLALDNAEPESAWNNRVAEAREAVEKLPRTNLRFRLERELNNTAAGAFEPLHHMTNIVVGQRIKHFSSALDAIGFKAQLITLPQFHTEAERGYSVAKAYKDQGIEGYVQHVQRVEEHLPESYTFLGHQKAVGTGVEAQLYLNLFDKQSDILAGSTEKEF